MQYLWCVVIKAGIDSTAVTFQVGFKKVTEPTLDIAELDVGFYAGQRRAASAINRCLSLNLWSKSKESRSLDIFYATLKAKGSNVHLCTGYMHESIHEYVTSFDCDGYQHELCR